MTHKTLIGGTAYEIKGGKTLVNGTAYEIKGGKTLVGGTAYEIGFGKCIFDFGTITTKKLMLSSIILYSIAVIVDFDPSEINTMIVNGVEYSVTDRSISSASDVFSFSIVGAPPATSGNLPSISANYPYGVFIGTKTSSGRQGIEFYSYVEGTYTVSLWKK